MASTKHLSLWKIWNLVLFKSKSYPHIYSSSETYEDMHQRLSIHITNYKLQSFSPYIDLSGSQHHFSLPWLSNHCVYASKTYIQCGLEEISCQTLTKEWWSWRKLKAPTRKFWYWLSGTTSASSSHPAVGFLEITCSHNYFLYSWGFLAGVGRQLFSFKSRQTCVFLTLKQNRLSGTGNRIWSITFATRKGCVCLNFLWPYIGWAAQSACSYTNINDLFPRHPLQCSRKRVGGVSSLMPSSVRQSV